MNPTMTDPMTERVLAALNNPLRKPDVELDEYLRSMLLCLKATIYAEETGDRADIDLAKDLAEQVKARHQKIIRNAKGL